MKKVGILPLIALFFFTGPLVAAEDGRQAIYEYIDIYKDIAIAEMERTGIPASIKMAQAILESNAGRSQLAVKANNHFGIKCGGDWNGGTHYQKDDDRDSRGRLIESCFRSYKSAEESFIAHSEFLSGPSRSSRYGWLFDLDPDDYKSWAHGLQKSGYATNRRYGNLLINVIENYHLYELDLMETPIASSADRRAREERHEARAGDGFFKAQSPPPPRREIEVNRVSAVRANAGETLADIALELDVSLRALLRFNDGLEDGFQPFDSDRNVFLERKRRVYRGSRELHRVQEGEEMADIANVYGIRLNVLHRRNRIDEGREPAVGERVYLRGRRNRNQPVRYRPANYRPPTEEVKPEEPRQEEEQKAESEEIIAATDTGSRSGNHTLDPEISNESQPGNSSAERERVNSGTSGFNNNQTTFDQSFEENNEQEQMSHTVSPGETLFAISRKYGLTVDELKARNNLPDNQLSIGQELIIRP